MKKKHRDTGAFSFFSNLKLAQWSFNILGLETLVILFQDGLWHRPH